MKTCSEYRAHSKAALAGRWTAPVILTLIFLLVSWAVSGVCTAPAMAFLNDNTALQGLKGLGTLVSLLIILPLTYGYGVAILKYFRKAEARDIAFGELFDGFKQYARIFGTLMLMNVYVMLWSLLLFIPGIIKAYSYKMTPYVLLDHPEMSNNAAIEESMRLMDGHKMQLFLLELSYIGWAILCVFTFGIGLLWLQPWMNTAEADFYQDLLAEDAAKNGNVVAE